jgi:hypothetical protein
MSMAGSDITVGILRGIRDEIRGMRSDTNERLDRMNERIDVTNQRLDVTIDRLDVTIGRIDIAVERLDVVESTLLDLVEQQRFVVRYTKATSERESRLEPRVINLEARVEKLESK